ncbi:hypothetical protein ABIA23_004526 [Sinorhizobium fredii]
MARNCLCADQPQPVEIQAEANRKPRQRRGFDYVRLGPLQASDLVEIASQQWLGNAVMKITGTGV